MTSAGTEIFNVRRGYNICERYTFANVCTRMERQVINVGALFTLTFLPSLDYGVAFSPLFYNSRLGRDFSSILPVLFYLPGFSLYTRTILFVSVYTYIIHIHTRTHHTYLTLPRAMRDPFIHTVIRNITYTRIIQGEKYVH